MATPRRLLPSVSLLMAFESVVRTGSTLAAANDLNLTQGAVSRLIQNLEAQLGVQHFRREGRRLVPTDNALAYAREVARAIDVISRASMRVRSTAAGGTLALSILMPKSPEEATAAETALYRPFARIEAHLAGRDWLLDRFTVADLMLAECLRYAAGAKALKLQWRIDDPVGAQLLEGALRVLSRLKPLRQPGRALVISHLIGAAALLSFGFHKPFCCLRSSSCFGALPLVWPSPRAAPLFRGLRAQRYLGRVLAVHSIGFMGGAPLGSALVGFAASQWGAHAAALAPAIGLALAALGLAVFTPLWRYSPASQISDPDG